MKTCRKPQFECAECGEEDSLDVDGLCPECSAIAHSERRSQAALQRWYQHVAR